jgi:hypothetical protein
VDGEPLRFQGVDVALVVCRGVPGAVHQDNCGQGGGHDKAGGNDWECCWKSVDSPRVCNIWGRLRLAVVERESVKASMLPDGGLKPGVRNNDSSPPLQQGPTSNTKPTPNHLQHGQSA